MVTILKKDLEEKDFLSQLELNELNNRKSVFENLQFFLSNNGYIKKIVEDIYDIDNSLLKTENDKNNRILLLNFLSTIFLYKKELESRKELEVQRNEIAEERELLRNEFDDFSFKVKEKVDLMLKDTLELKLKYEEEVRRNSSLLSQLEYKEETLEIALETVYDLNQKVLELTEKNKGLVLRIKNIKAYLSKIVDKKIKDRNEGYLKILEEELKGKLKQELNLKKKLLEEKIDKINNSFNLALSSKDLEIAKLNELIDVYKNKILDLENKILEKTDENIDLILEKTKQVLIEPDNKQVKEEKEIEKLKLMLKKEKEEKEKLKKENKDLKKKNKDLTNVTKTLTKHHVEKYKKNMTKIKN